MNLVIDVGNTRTKLAVFQNNRLIELIVVDESDLKKALEKIFIQYKINFSIISKVADFSKENLILIKKNTNYLELNSNTKLPFNNLYSTPHTLGLDRLALATAAYINFPNQNVLTIDAGTCITYDFLNANKEYLGGAIAPGLSMRYKSLKAFTANLPLLDPKEPKNFIGNSTSESIHSGVVNGLIQEIKGVIKQYEKKYQYLTVVLTGGDTKFLSKQLKSSIFANQNFLLEGLNEILIFNKNK